MWGGGANSRFANWVDYDNDGDLDLYVSNSHFENNLYENRINENNTFLEISYYYALNDSGRSGASNWFDYDNDGDLDLFLANLIDPNFPHLYPGSKLYRNEINITGQFVDITNAIGIFDTTSSRSCTVGDYDNDGDLDLYLGCYGRGLKNKLFRNDVNISGLFTEFGAIANVADTMNALGTLSGDYDNDGDLDLYVMNLSDDPCRMYKNNTNSSSFLKFVY